MADLAVVVPTRGRPESATALARVFADTCTANTRLVFSIDADDPRLDDYSPLIRNGFIDLDINANESMVEALNTTALKQKAFAVGFMGDDHCPRTHGWDQLYLSALSELGAGIVYGNDLLQGSRLPTQCAMTSDIIQALGYMSPPELRHMYVDNFWLDLGTEAGCIRYMPEVVVEHRHPLAGKAEWDAGYARVNDRAVYQADAAAYATYCHERFPTDVEKVRALRG